MSGRSKDLRLGTPTLKRWSSCPHTPLDPAPPPRLAWWTQRRHPASRGVPAHRGQPRVGPLGVAEQGARVGTVRVAFKDVRVGPVGLAEQDVRGVGGCHRAAEQDVRVDAVPSKGGVGRE